MMMKMMMVMLMMIIDYDDDESPFCRVITADNLNLRYDFEGNVEWEPPVLFNVHCQWNFCVAVVECQVDVTFYPYDQHKCAIVVIGWGYTVEEVDLAFLSQAINTDDLE
ncbi:hypothetical protein DPMN_188123 [Dreissena polymorpha]|uniref:Neurotransmitter-gated ion-channel ligand-binding domain-containing protein n=1 Tax=Dreissena polymorpha TaxID=45954 RepID=A0A9D4DQB2_DREPO|nr:hypothetical protein DPMN_188123 [Dreissena polymorpha]